jgi:hypothetical protein
VVCGAAGLEDTSGICRMRTCGLDELRLHQNVLAQPFLCYGCKP